jgi:hypothetical protein
MLQKLYLRLFTVYNVISGNVLNTAPFRHKQKVTADSETGRGLM